MKLSITLLAALASAALAKHVEQRGDYYGEDYGEDYGDDYGKEHGHETTMTTYTTVTTCPVTSTYTEKGTTYCVTELTTSTLTVTECYGCEGGVVTVPGPTVTAPVKTEVEVTYTTVCPTTETIVGPTHTEYRTYTTTAVRVTHIPTTIYKSVPGPEVTKHATDTEYSYYTTVCPVTETKTLEGKVQTVTYTTTKVIPTHVKSVVEETEYKPGPTKTAYETEYQTRTSLCPYTTTLTISGKETTKVYTSTETIVEKVPTAIKETEYKPGKTATEYETEYQTRTTLCPYTETLTISGKETTKVYTSVSTIVEKVPTAVHETAYKPGETEVAYHTAYETITSLYPVTETRTVSGKAVTKVYTTTEVVVQQVPTTIEALETIYHTLAQTEVETEYSKVFVTVGGGTVIQTITPLPGTVVVPTTSVVSIPEVTATSEAQAPPPPASTSAPAVVPTAAAYANQAPAVALLAGVVGALALI